tara:strand:+ start:593 stop:1804 length:1212 start_codon:yes stop_codon:yes gene_type:complete
MIINIKEWLKNKRKTSPEDIIKINKIFKSLESDNLNNFSFLKQDKDKDLFSRIDKISSTFLGKKKIVLVGTGGSSLGAKTLLDLEYNNKIVFIENIDPEYINQKILSLNTNSLGFIIISKSGETVEVLSILNILQNKLSSTTKLYKNSIIVSDRKDSTLSRLAKKFKIPLIYHDPKIGGRYSCFSITGLLPAQISGLDSKKIKRVANEYSKKYFNIDKSLNKKNISCLIDFVRRKDVSGHVFLCYQESLKSLMLWYRQLWAESLGKKGAGLHLITAMGSVDQHSQLQMWLEGRKDLIFTVVVPKKRQSDFKILDNANILPDYLNNKSVGNILNKMCEATIQELIKLKVPVRVIYLEDDSIKSAIKLMTTLIMEVPILCEALNINPFNQPAVEKVKKLTKSLLS